MVSDPDTISKTEGATDAEVQAPAARPDASGGAADRNPTDQSIYQSLRACLDELEEELRRDGPTSGRRSKVQSICKRVEVLEQELRRKAAQTRAQGAIEKSERPAGPKLCAAEPPPIPSAEAETAADGTATAAGDANGTMAGAKRSKARADASGSARGAGAKSDADGKPTSKAADGHARGRSNGRAKEEPSASNGAAAEAAAGPAADAKPPVDTAEGDVRGSRKAAPRRRSSPNGAAAADLNGQEPTPDRQPVETAADAAPGSGGAAAVKDAEPVDGTSTKAKTRGEAQAKPKRKSASKDAGAAPAKADAAKPAEDMSAKPAEAKTRSGTEAKPEPVSEDVGPAPSETKTAKPEDDKPVEAKAPEREARDESRAPETARDRTSEPGGVEARGPLNGKTGPNGSRKSNGSAAGGDGGRGGGSAPLLKRSSDPNFRDVLGKGLAACRRGLVTVGIFSLFVNLLLLAIPIYLFQISDRVLTSRSIDTLVILTGIVIGALAVHVILDMLRRFVLLRVATEMECKLGAPVLSAAAKVSDAGSNKEFQALSDLQQLRSFITGSVLLQMFDAPLAPVFFVVVFLIHPQLGFIITGAGLALLVIGLVNQKITALPFARANAFSMRANYQADALSRNAQVLNAMGMIREGVQLWGRETADSLKAQVVGQDRNIVTAGLSKFVRLATQVAVLGWGAMLALDGQLTGGMIIAASIVGSRALAPVEGTIDGWRGFIQARAAYGRIKQLLKSSPLNLERLQLPRPTGRLDVERLLYVPPPTKRVILNGVSFSLEPGESLAIVGPSGAGKSTLARMIVGSLTPTAGNVRLDQMDLRNWDPRQFGESVGYLPQDVELFPASIKANIARMREDATDESIFDAAELAGVHEMIADFAQGYETQIAMDGSPLSGGQKQRIALARAFFGEPRLVVLDEPNSNLDAPGERALADALLRAKEKEISIVAVTQRPSLLKSVDKIMMLKEGCIEAIGTRDEIVARRSNAKAALPPKRRANGSGTVSP